MTPRFPMRVALNDPALLGDILAGDSWASWRTLLIASMGEPLTGEERSIFAKLTGGRDREPGRRIEELWAVIGRRGGKSKAIATLACYLATLVDYSDCLSLGETGVLLVLAQNQKQATVVFDYISAFFGHVPSLRALILNETRESISLSNGIVIEIRAASYRGLRGITCIGTICDEVSIWFTEGDNSRNTDSDILEAIRPSLGRTDGPLICISTPRARVGEVWSTYKAHFGSIGDPLIVVTQASTQTMNPTYSDRKLQRHYEKDPVSASAEYGAQFRSDLESYISLEAIEAVVVPGRFELSPLPIKYQYIGFVDAAGGNAGGDSMTIGISHSEGEGLAVLDCIREVEPPFSPESVVDEFVVLLQNYGVKAVCGDRWGSNFVQEMFEKRGITYNVSEQTKSELYKELLPMINSGQVELLDHKRLAAQLSGLERRTARGGRDSIDHAQGAHDDVANAAAGALVLAGVGDSELEIYLRAYGTGGGWDMMKAQIGYVR